MPTSQQTFPDRLNRVILIGMEATILGLVVFSPWAFGSIHAYFEFYLWAGAAAVACLWGIRMVVMGRLIWANDPVSWCIIALFVTGILQLAPLGFGSVSTSFLPEQAELIPGESGVEAVLPAGSAISAYPGATRRELFRFLALMLAWLAVRNNLAGKESLQRLSVVAVANGALLSLFALVQFFAFRYTLFGMFPTGDHSFGPFISRNHFPYYLNLCIGLGIGLLLGDRAASDDPNRDWRQVLQHPRTLWLCGALALMASSVVFCLSRGGVLAMLVAAVVCLAVKFGRSRKLARLETALLVILPAIGLLAWFGLGVVQARMATIWQGEALHGRRIEVWQRVMPLAAEAPVWGTGWGTFRYVEPLTRRPGDSSFEDWSHAHNDYLEVLIEGGIIKLGLCFLAIILVYRIGYRAYCRYEGGLREGLIMGALFGFTAVVVHSFVDFGLHIPAVMLLTTVVAAQLVGQSNVDDPPSPRREIVAPVAAALALTVLAYLLVQEGRRRDLAERYRLAAARTATSLPDRIAFLRAAVQYQAANAALHVDLAEAELEAYQTSKKAGLLRSALHEYLVARDLCPLLSQPYIRLAANHQHLANAARPSDYLNRAKRILPGDAELWYLAGRQELAEGMHDQAWQSWRHSLQCAPTHLRDILDQSAKLLSHEELVKNVLPDDGKLVLDAARYLFPDGEDEAEWQPYLHKALSALEKQNEPLAAEDLALKGWIYRKLDEPKKAIAAYQLALVEDPFNAEWRFALAEAFHEHGMMPEARTELVTLLTQQPGHAAGKKLLLEINRRGEK